MMKMGGVNRFDQFNGVARALTVHGDRTRLLGPQVSDLASLFFRIKK